MKQDAFVLNEHELRYFLRLLSKEHIEAKRKLESAQTVYERIDDLLQRACSAYAEIQEERERQEDE